MDNANLYSSDHFKVFADQTWNENWDCWTGVCLPFSDGVPGDLTLLKLAVASWTRCESEEAI